MKLVNGDEAKYVKDDEFGRGLYLLVISGKPLKTVMVDGKLYTRTKDGEPESRLRDVYQPKGEHHDS